tara:strand:- start:7659 stop:8696 length:1038 start_codon:yes stop_codon:yes gene_type:complete
MTLNLVILTTAITRGDFHKKTIGKFYELYGDKLIKYNVYHIINLDLPEKLKEHFDKEYTIQLFKKIIPKYVSLEIIDNKSPGFLQAYKNVVNMTYNLNLVKKNTLIWWFEDDWKFLMNNFHNQLFDIIELFPIDNAYAFNSVISSPLGSFRGGPIMTTKYFKKYFDIINNNAINNTGDPEKQIGRWISGNIRLGSSIIPDINTLSEKKKKNIIHRNIKNDDIINIVYFYFNKDKTNVEYEIKKKIGLPPVSYYNKPTKFNHKIKFNYYIIVSNNLKIHYFSKLNIENYTLDLKKMNISDILEKISNNGINYICIKPWLFKDVGRIFNNQYKLKKWINSNDGTTYT